MMSECSCEKCQGACTYVPGWFKPGEAERVADHLDMPLQELFKTHLGVNWWVSSDDIYVLAPATTGMEPGGMYHGNPHGSCVFFHEGKCQIHDVKPFECAEFIHTDSGHDVYTRHEAVAKSWLPHQGQIKDLLGNDPVSEPYYRLGIY